MVRMSLLYKLLSKSPNYIKRFGFLHGIRLLLQIERYRHLPQHSNDINKYNVPGLSAPVYLRACVGDHATFWQCIVRGQYDFNNFPQALRIWDKYAELVASTQCPPLIIDCGGNIGLSAIWFANYFDKSRIYVVEPDDSNLKILKMNVENYADRVVVLKGGVWNESGYVRIINPEAGPASFQLELVVHGDLTNAVQCYTVDEICKMADNDFPLIVKLDIEGSQKHLFSSNTDWVNRVNLITLELDDWLLPWQGTSQNFFKCLSQYRFDYLLSGESIFCFRDSS
jgi:FkbM family methyltransferase